MNVREEFEEWLKDKYPHAENHAVRQSMKQEPVYFEVWQGAVATTTRLVKQETAIQRTGTLEITSSGYTDRYVQSQSWANIAVDGITYRVDHEQATRAYMRLSGIADEDGAFWAIQKSPFQMYITEQTSATETLTVGTTANRIREGIRAATGFPGMNETAKSEAKKVAATLTENEWKIIQAGLARINELHAKSGRPVVNFTVPV